MTKKNYIIYIAFLIASFGYIFNFDSAIISSSIEILALTFKISKKNIGFLITVSLFGSLAGGMLSGYLSEKIGRKKTIIYSLINFIIGGIITSFSINIYFFMFGRILMGLSLGSIFLVGSIYITEVSPSKNRGKNGSISQLLMPFGLIFGFFIVYLISNYITNNFIISNSWRILFLFETFQVLIMLFLFLKVPESPRWLFFKGNKSQAILNLGFFLPDKQINKVINQMESSNNNFISTKKIIINKGLFIVLILATIFPFFRQLSGINPIIYYAPQLFKEFSMNTSSGYYQSIFMGIFQILGSLISLFFIDKWGRKVLLFIGTLGISLSLGYITYSLILNEKNILEIYSLYFYNFTYTFSLGTILTIYISEILPTNIRSLGVTIFTFFNYIFDIILTQIFPIIETKTSYLPFLIFFITSTFLLIFIPFIPETKGKTLEDIEKYWDNIL